MANADSRRGRASSRHWQRGAARAALIIVAIVAAAGVFAIGWAAGRGAGAPARAAGPAAVEGAAREAAAVGDDEDRVLYWTCSMHPQIKAEGPGACPICAMDLVPVREGGAGAGGDETALALSEGARRLAQVETTLVERRSLESTVRMVGRIDYAETNLAQVSARTAGRIDDLFVNYTGASVKRGDKLVSIYSPELRTAQEEFLIALRRAQAAGQAGGSDAAAAARVAEAVRKKLELWGMLPEQMAELEKTGRVDDHTAVYAPISGTVTSRDVTEGQYVEEGQPILTISDLSTVWALLEAHESDVARLAPGQQVTFAADALPGEELEGEVEFVNSFVDEATRTVKVRASVENPGERLKPGMYVNAVVTTAPVGGAVAQAPAAARYVCPMKCEGDKAYDKPGICPVCHMGLEKMAPADGAAQGTASPAVPAGAVLDSGTRKIVYVEKKPGLYEAREVALGPRSGGYFPVLSGVSEGERVVTRGAFLIDSQFQIMGRGSLFYPGGLRAAESTAAQEAAPGGEPAMPGMGGHRH